jgi:hypothetical protein
LNHYLENDAVISDCGRYRYLLRRVWYFDKPRALFVMLNPSTADAKIDDPTIRSCVRLVSALGYGSMEVVNLFGYRSTDPDGLRNLPDAVGPKNDDIAEAAIGRCDMVICAWGGKPIAKLRAREMWEKIRSMRPAAFCFGLTDAGCPKHPLYIKSGTQLQSYTA